MPDPKIPTREQQKAQGAKCGCLGTDDYCTCQNVVQGEPRTPAITPAALRYLAADFICNADHPLHRERLKGVVRLALEQAADELEARGG